MLPDAIALIKDSEDEDSGILRIDKTGETGHSAVNFGSKRAGLPDHRALKTRSGKPAPERARIVARHGHNIRRLHPLPSCLFNERANHLHQPARRHTIMLAPGNARDHDFARGKLKLFDEKLLHACWPT